ncbi:MAG: hypothetical protein M3N18_12645, partial [Actinomycetota bacterium]|nr:hypothetical protein [Actinomycetota bacterium]
EVAYLKEVVATRDEELRRKDTIIMTLAQRVPELEAAQEPPHARETAAGEPEGPEARPATGETQEAARRPWWRRWLGG